MKKQLRRFFCFFMCFCLCFAWFGPPMEAQAVGIAYAIYVLIIWMASFGVGFVASGAADCLYDGIEGWVENFISSVEEYQSMTVNDWLAAIAADFVVNNSGYIAVGTTAAEMMTEFMAWLESEQFGSDQGDVAEFSSSSLLLPDVYVGGVLVDVEMSTPVEGSDVSDWANFEFERLGTVFSKSDFSQGVSFISDGKEILYKIESSNLNIYVDGVLSDSRTSFLKSSYSGMTFSNYYHVRYNYSYTNTDLNFTYILSSNGNGYAAFSSSLYASEQESSGSVLIGSEGLSYPDPSTWPVGFSGYVLNTGEVVFNSVDDIDTTVNDAILNGELEVVPEITTEEAPPITSDGTLEGDVSAIFQSVAALPQTLANLILDGIKNIFFPDPDDMNEQFMTLLEEINDKYSFDFDLEALFSGEKEPDDITAQYTVGPLSWDLTFVSWYYLKKGVVFFRPYIRGFIVLLLIFFQLRQFMSVLNMVSLESGSGGSAPSGASTSLVVRDSGGVVKR